MKSFFKLQWKRSDMIFEKFEKVNRLVCNEINVKDIKSGIIENITHILFKIKLHSTRKKSPTIPVSSHFY